jgi:Family of unknown function (DUF6049)
MTGMPLRLPLLCVGLTSAATVVLAPLSAASPAPAVASQPLASFAHARALRAADPAQETTLQRRTGLTVTIDDIEPATLVPGRPLQVTGTVSNHGEKHWRKAQVYLEVGGVPATTREGLDAFAAADAVLGTRLISLRLFDQIGAVRPGEASSYALNVPFRRLPIAGSPGVYNIGVSVLAVNRAGSNPEADARTDTLVPLLPSSSHKRFRPTSVATLLPITAPVLRQNNGNFLDDKLASEVSPGGRLADVLRFARRAPPRSLQVVLDPALRDAVQAMAQGYVVQTLTQSAHGQPGRPGTGQRQARRWLHGLNAVARHQPLSLMPWGTPDPSALAAHSMPGVVEAAVTASRSYATLNTLDSSVIGWQPSGYSSRLGLSVMRRAGTSIQVVDERSLTRLTPEESDYPPSVVSVPTHAGPLSAVVTRQDVAGVPMSVHIPVLQLRQRMLAEATVRSLLHDPGARQVVFALPFHWDPGPRGHIGDLGDAYDTSAIRPTTLNLVVEHVPTPYNGPVSVPRRVEPYPERVLAAVAELRDSGRVLTSLLTRGTQATASLDQRLGVAGSSAWRDTPRTAAAMIKEEASAFAHQLAKVTVTGPAFVALSSTSGRFPVTVTNGLHVPITVGVHVRPLNPALKVDSVNTLQLAAGQRRDVQVVSRAKGSGLTQVRVRLTTPDHRLFGVGWNFNVRATQFGVVIWVAMGIGAAVLFGAAALRIYRRVKESRRSPSSSASPVPR